MEADQIVVLALILLCRVNTTLFMHSMPIVFLYHKKAWRKWCIV